MSNLKLNLENVVIHEIELCDSEDNCSSEDSKEVDVSVENDAWISKTLEPKLLTMSVPCNCRMREVMERQMRRAQLLPDQAMRQAAMQNIQLEQEDVDSYMYYVVVTTKHGVFDEIKYTIRQCKKCGLVTMYGDCMAISQLVAESITTLMNSEEFVGEIADDHVDTLSSLMGVDTGSDEYIVADVDYDPNSEAEQSDRNEE